jgi:hypothetical protein
VPKAIRLAAVFWHELGLRVDPPYQTSGRYSDELLETSKDKKETAGNDAM